MQSNTAKILVALGSIAVIVVLGVVFASGGDDDAESVAETTTTTTELPADAGEAADDAGRPAEPEKPAKPAVQTIVVRGGAPKGGVQELEFAKGERVRFEIDSDVSDEIHVHGYDIYEDIEAGRKAKVSFPAEIDGVFEIELHGSGRPIAELTVKPS